MSCILSKIFHLFYICLQHSLEEILQSINLAFLDVATTEYHFLDRFVNRRDESPSNDRHLCIIQSAADLFEMVMGPTMKELEGTVLPGLIKAGQHDLLGLLSSVALIYSLNKLAKERDLHVLER